MLKENQLSNLRLDAEEFIPNSEINEKTVDELTVLIEYLFNDDLPDHAVYLETVSKIYFLAYTFLFIIN